MNRRNFIYLLGCGCISYGLSSCSSVPITERKQLKLIPESNLNAKAAHLYEQIKKKEKLSDDKKSLDEIKEIGLKIENSISEYFYRNNTPDPTSNFDWEYILIENKKVKNAWCMPGGKIAVYTGMLEITKNEDNTNIKLDMMRIKMLLKNNRSRNFIYFTFIRTSFYIHFMHYTFCFN